MRYRPVESAPRLPLEVIEQIIDASRGDRSLLRNLALTSKVLIPRSQAHLFHTLEFDLAYDYPGNSVSRDMDVYDRVRATAHRLSGASAFFRTRTHLLSYVQSFLFRQNSFFTQEIATAFGELLPHLVNLRAVHLENWDWTRPMKDGSDMHALLAQLYQSISGRRGSRAVIRNCYFNTPSELAMLLHDYESVDLSASYFIEDTPEDLDTGCRPKALCLERIPSEHMRRFLNTPKYLDLSAVTELECSTLAIRHIIRNMPDHPSFFAQIETLIVPFDPSSDSNPTRRIPLHLFTALQVLDIQLIMPIRQDYRIVGSQGYLDLIRETVGRVMMSGIPALCLRELYIGKFHILEAGYEQRTVEELESALPDISVAFLDRTAFPALERVQIDVRGDTMRHAAILKGVFEELMPGIMANGILNVNATYEEPSKDTSVTFSARISAVLFIIGLLLQVLGISSIWAA